MHFFLICHAFALFLFFFLCRKFPPQVSVWSNTFSNRLNGIHFLQAITLPSGAAIDVTAQNAYARINSNNSGLYCLGEVCSVQSIVAAVNFPDSRNSMRLNGRKMLCNSFFVSKHSILQISIWINCRDSKFVKIINKKPNKTNHRHKQHHLQWNWLMIFGAFATSRQKNTHKIISCQTLNAALSFCYASVCAIKSSTQKPHTTHREVNVKTLSQIDTSEWVTEKYLKIHCRFELDVFVFY